MAQVYTTQSLDRIHSKRRALRVLRVALRRFVGGALRVLDALYENPEILS